jgi:F5/8 type C domain-containing protein/cellulase (glycosyl hydrolase family 5)
MTAAACRAKPRIVKPGKATFTIVNRTRRPRLFTIAGRRTRNIRPRRAAVLRLPLVRTGRYHYSCISRGRRRLLRTGVLTVRLPPRPPPPEHRIGVRPTGATSELYDRVTGRTFVPRGNNYVRLGPQQYYDGRTFTYHSTFNVGVYDGARAESALRRMRTDGYNVVRVFLNGLCRNACLGDPDHDIRAAYLDNVADFLRRAKANDMLVVLTQDWLPVQTSYDRLLAGEPRTWVDSWSVDFLTNGGVRANAQFFRDLATALIRQGAPTDDVLAYELRNELNFDGANKPFTLTSGLAPMPNGRTYDLSSPTQKDKLLDDGLVYWIGQVRDALRAVDPTALVTVGFFEPQEPNPSRRGDPRVIRTRAAIRESSMDFVDVHPYPGGELTLPQYMENFGIDGTEAKPIVIGEMGAAKFAYPRLDEAVYPLLAWQHDSCAYGIDGWLTWTWDTDEQPELWNALSGGGVIERALAPSLRPDPCALASGPRNIALGKPATASRSEPGSPPSLAVDGLANSAWISGAFPPQWLQVDLGSPQEISRVRLLVTQSPDGYTAHRIWGRASLAEPEQLLHEFAGITHSGDTLEFAPSTAWHDIRFVRVETVTSPSWVGWSELEVISAG